MKIYPSVFFVGFVVVLIAEVITHIVLKLIQIDAAA
jgi:hypothetical protein